MLLDGIYFPDRTLLKVARSFSEAEKSRWTVEIHYGDPESGQAGGAGSVLMGRPILNHKFMPGIVPSDKPRVSYPVDTARVVRMVRMCDNAVIYSHPKFQVV